MDTDFTEEQEQLRISVRRFLADNAAITPYVRGLLHDPVGTSEEVWGAMADLGLLGLAVPVDCGGAGGTVVDLGVVLEELGRAVHPGPYISTAVAAAALVRTAGSPDDQFKLLPGFADGSAMAAVVLPERGALGFTASRRSDDAGPNRDRLPWAVSGSASWVLDGAAAGVVLIAAPLDGSIAAPVNGPSDGPPDESQSPDGLVYRVFVVGRDAAGFVATPQPTIDPTRSFATITLDHSPAWMLGEATPPVMAGRVVAAALARTRDLVNLALVVDGVGAAVRALEMTVDYAKERYQFGVPIGSFQAVQHICADMLSDLEIARAGAYYALWTADAASADELHRAVTMAMAFAADALPRVGANTIQVHGGVGFTWEHDAHLYYKRLLTLQVAGGGSATHLEALAAALLE